MAIRLEEKVILSKSELRELFRAVIEVTRFYAKIFPDKDGWQFELAVYEELGKTDKTLETLLNEER